MNAIFVVAAATALLGTFLALYGVLATLDRVPAIHARLVEWMPERDE